MEPQNTLNSRSNLEKDEQNWKYRNLRFQDILQSCSNQNSMVLAQKQIYRSMEQNKEPRNTHIHLIQEKGKNMQWGGKTV